MYKIAILLLITTLYALPSLAQKPGADDAGTLTSDSVAARELRRLGFEFTDRNEMEFFTTAHDKFEDLFEEIDRAKTFIHLEYFNFRNDSIAGLLFNHLARKAAEGVEVRAMYDAFGNMSNNSPISKAMHDSICALGIKLVKFDPIRFPWVNHVFGRDHRKIVVIDGRIGYTGGMNVADYYITGTKEVGPWHDLHMKIQGPAVARMEDIFAETWYKETGELLSDSKYVPRVESDFHSLRLAIVNRAGGKPRRSAIRDLYVTMINSARHHIQIINPYFVPTHRVRQALKDAVDRGVDVEIMLSEASDQPMTPNTTHYVGHNLSKRGARVYLYQGGFHHTKMMVVDDIYCTVGSSNLDARSLRCDLEINALIMDKEKTQELMHLFEMEKMHCYQIGRDFWKKYPTGKKFLGWLGNLLTPVM